MELLDSFVGDAEEGLRGALPAKDARQLAVRETRTAKETYLECCSVRFQTPLQEGSSKLAKSDEREREHSRTYSLSVNCSLTLRICEFTWSQKKKGA